MESSIGLSARTKTRLAEAKPPWMPWDDYLVALLRSNDGKRLAGLLDRAYREAEQDATQRAKARYRRYRTDRSGFLTGEELKARLRLRRAANRLEALGEALRTAAEGSTSHPWDLLDEAEKEIRELQRARDG